MEERKSKDVADPIFAQMRSAIAESSPHNYCEAIEREVLTPLAIASIAALVDRTIGAIDP